MLVALLLGVKQLALEKDSPSAEWAEKTSACLADSMAARDGDSSRQQTRNDFAAVAAVNLEVCIRGENERVWQDFGEPDHAGIGGAHGDVLILVEQR
jgi:hypothetical protein